MRNLARSLHIRWSEPANSAQVVANWGFTPEFASQFATYGQILRIGSSGERARQGMTTRRQGFSLIELLIAVVVLGVMTAISMPHVQRVIASKRVTSAATVVAIDLEQAFTLASRQRRPVILACDCAARTYTITDAASGRVYLSRNLGADAALQVDTLNFSTPSVTVYPRGTSSTPMQVTLRGAGSSHRIAMTTAGIVRVID